MIELPIPGEIDKYEAKLVGPLTTRQTLFGGAALVADLLIYNHFKSIIPVNTLYIIMVMIVVPLALLGWCKPYDMHLEKFILAVLYNTLLSPTKRYFASASGIADVKSTDTKNKDLAESLTKKEIKAQQKQTSKEEKSKAKAVKVYRKSTFA